MRRFLSITIFLLLALVTAGCNLNNPASLPTPPAPATLESDPTPLVDPLQPPPIVLTPLQTTNHTPAPLLGTPTPGQDVTFPLPESAFPSNYPNLYEVEVRAGRILVVSYDVVVNNPGVGRFFIVVRDPAGQVVARMAVLATERSELEVPTTVGGIYEIGAAIQNLSGSYNLSFGTR